MDTFKKLNLIEKRKMAIEELVNYYAEYRIYCYNKGDKLKGIELRKKIHPLINLILKIDEVLSKEENIIVANENKAKEGVPKIFACTHIGGNDIQRTFQIIKEPAYLMLGDPGILYKMPIYQGLKMNGVIPLETKNKIDRKIAYNRSIELLNNGGNLLIYPEGAWNVTPNVIVMKTFVGTVRMAKEAGVHIVPIAVVSGNVVFKNMLTASSEETHKLSLYYGISKNTTKSETELNHELRDKLATLKWQLLESQPQLQRKNIPEGYIHEFQKEIVERCNYGYGFSLEDAISESFHDKTIINEEEVFSFLDNLDININNAFLLRSHSKTLKR